MKYFRLYRDGETVHNGFNFYRLGSDSFGFKFRFGPRIPMTDLGSTVWYVRWSKNARKLFMGFVDVSECVTPGWTVTQADIDTLEDDLQRLERARRRGIRR